MRGKSAGSDGSHAGRSAKGARIRDGADPKFGKLSEVLAVESVSVPYPANTESATNNAQATAAGFTAF